MSDQNLFVEEIAQVREQTYREEEELRASTQEIDEMIEEYGFRLDEDDPENGGFLCDYFPTLEEDPELQRRILYNQYRIYQELLSRYHEEKARLESLNLSEKERAFRLKEYLRSQRNLCTDDDPSKRLRVIK